MVLHMKNIRGPGPKIQTNVQKKALTVLGAYRVAVAPHIYIIYIYIIYIYVY